MLPNLAHRLLYLLGLTHAAVAFWDSDPKPLQVVNLTAPDGSARANFIPYGATATNFWVKDKTGNFRDILLGYDNVTWYESEDVGRNFFGPIVGRYANRIRNGTFTIPVTKNVSGPNKYQVPENEHNGTNSLHGGEIGYDRRPWSVLYKTANAVTFGLVDPDGEQGFPGTVLVAVTYALEAEATWKISMNAIATAETPIMLSGHHFWNLDAYQDSEDLLGHVAQFDASRVIATDGNLIPNGELIDVTGTPLDFREAKSIGESINDTEPFAYCGTDCVGFDNAWIYDTNSEDEPVFSVWSTNSGIKLDVITNQPALQIYSCNGIFNPDLPIPRKAAHGGPSSSYPQHSCLVIEQESWLDAINNPEGGHPFVVLLALTPSS
ncbi:galactose mutarotase-like protein [Hymenopellis radicata]|nr:galactose mutarotase-like protein [Hymenopellis radicata]